VGSPDRRAARAQPPGPPPLHGGWAARQTQLQLDDRSACGVLARAQLAGAQSRVAETQVFDVQRQRRDVRRVEIVGSAACGRDGSAAVGRGRLAPVHARQLAGDCRALRVGDQQRAGQRIAIQRHRQRLLRGCQLQARIGEHRADHQQTLGGDVDVAQRQRSPFAAALGQRHPLHRIQRAGAAGRDQS